jgi:dinuclear metal center YbgI/SA1388 family protein
MKVKDICRALEQWAPPSLAESYDNVGLLVGLPDMAVTGVLVTLDVTEAVLAEAVAKGCNMVVAHHPVWFMPRKRLNGEDFVSRIIMAAVKQDIALYAIHTNLDNVRTGVNAEIGSRLGVTDMRVLSPKRDLLQKVIAYGASWEMQNAADAMYRAGAVQLKSQESGGSTRLEAIVPAYAKSAVLAALQQNFSQHTVESHSVATLEPHLEVGSGMIGRLERPMRKGEFLEMVKAAFGCGGIRYADAPLELVQTVAWCGGAGSFLIPAALRAGAQALVTADITYHKFFEQEDKMLLLDIGHYESEQFTSHLILKYLSENFASFAVRFSEVITNPVKYL